MFVSDPEFSFDEAEAVEDAIRFYMANRADGSYMESALDKIIAVLGD